MCVICMIGIHTLVCKPIYACKLKLQWVIHYHNHNHIPSGCSRHGFSLILGITHLSSQSTLTHMLSLSTLLQMHLSIHTSPLPPTHTHTKRRPAESHGSFTLSAPNAHLSHSPVVFLHLKSPNILSPHSFIFPFSFFLLHPSFPSLLPVIHSSRMHPPLLISVAILRLLFLAGLFAEMTGLSLNLKHLISLHKARRLLYASTIRWYNACAVNGSQCARGHAWHAIYPHCSHSISVIYNACAAMVLGHICPMTEPPTFTGNLHTWALLMVSNMQSRSLMVCVCV